MNDDRKPAAKPLSRFDDEDSVRENGGEAKPCWKVGDFLADADILSGGLRNDASFTKSTTDSLDACSASAAFSSIGLIPPYEYDGTDEESLLQIAYKSYDTNFSSKRWNEAAGLSNLSSPAVASQSYKSTGSVTKTPPHYYMYGHDEQPDLARADSSSVSTNTSCSSFARMPNSGNSIENSDVLVEEEKRPVLLRTESGNLFDAQDPETIDAQKELYDRLSSLWPNKIRTTSGGILNMLDANLVQEQLRIEEEIKKKKIKAKLELSHSSPPTAAQKPQAQAQIHSKPKLSQELHVANVPEAQATPIVDAVATPALIPEVQRDGNAQKVLQQKQDSRLLGRYHSVRRRSSGSNGNSPAPVPEARAVTEQSSVEPHVYKKQDKHFLRRLRRGRLTSTTAEPPNNPSLQNHCSRTKSSTPNRNKNSTATSRFTLPSASKMIQVPSGNPCREEIFNEMYVVTTRCGGCSHPYKLPSKAKNLYCPQCSTLTPVVHGHPQDMNGNAPNKLLYLPKHQNFT